MFDDDDYENGKKSQSKNSCSPDNTFGTEKNKQNLVHYVNSFIDNYEFFFLVIIHSLKGFHHHIVFIIW